MPIVNRDVDVSQQKEVVHFAPGALATGVTRLVCNVPYPCTLQNIQAAAIGVSNAMQVTFNKLTFVAAGATVQNLGVSNLVLVNQGTSGPQGFSGLAVSGSTLLNLQAGDVLFVTTSVANGNATDLTLNFVLKKTQDIVSHDGTSA
jgi:hypothetical protein